jgi:hypothetical protein
VIEHGKRAVHTDNNNTRKSRDAKKTNFNEVLRKKIFLVYVNFQFNPIDARNNREGKNSRGSLNHRNVNRKTPATSLMPANSRYARNSRYASISRDANSSRFPRNFEENLGFPKMATLDAS